MPYKLTNELSKTPAGRAALDRERVKLLEGEVRQANRQYDKLLAAAVTLADWARDHPMGLCIERAIKAVAAARRARAEREIVGAAKKASNQ